jgi:(4S)-4-hydroxy-5-phosphonooxypentane-2,3-dione isomerase
MSEPLFVVHIQVRVKPDSVDAFIAASLENARGSILEPGIARFDVAQSQDDPTRFVFVEVFKTPDASDAHKRTAHYLKWRDIVADMMAEPRSGSKFHNLFPASEDW